MCKNAQQITLVVTGNIPKNYFSLILSFFISLTISACSSSAPPAQTQSTAVQTQSPEFQKRLKVEQDAKNQQELNNRIRAMNFQIQLQNRQEGFELERLRAVRAAQRLADRAARRAEEEKNRNQ